MKSVIFFLFSGALVNAVFLVALCFSISIESLKRFYEPEDIHDPEMILIVGSLGLIVNLLGLCLFHEHGHGHGHSHGGHSAHGTHRDILTLRQKRPYGDANYLQLVNENRNFLAEINFKGSIIMLHFISF